jgi:hypothetical protein
MTDDFDKRRPPDEESEDDFDWLKDVADESSSNPRSGENLGFTGELSWRQDVEKAFDDQLDEANSDTPDWQQNDNQPAGQPGKAGGLGFTGELDWLRASGQEEAAPEANDTDVPDWLAQMDLAQSSPPVDETPDDSPDVDDSMAWLQEDDEFEEEPEPATLNDAPDWMKELSGLRDNDEPEPQAANTLPDTGALDWLQEYAAEPEVEQPVDDFELPPEPDAEADVPDWLAGAYDTAEPAANLFTDELNSEVVEGAPADVDLPSWLMEDTPADLPDANDLFGEFDTGMLREAAEADYPAPQPEEEVPPAEDAPKGRITDWLERESEAANAKIEQDDFLNTLPEFTNQTTGEIPVTGELPPTPSEGNWFDEAEPEPFGAADGVPDWLTELQEQGDLTVGDGNAPVQAGSGYDMPDDDDLFAGLDLDDLPAQPAASSSDEFFNTGELRNIDDILASYKDIETGVSDQTSGLVNQANFDMDSLLSDDELDKISSLRQSEERRAEMGDLSPEAPDWLSDIGVSVGSDDVSAAAIVRKQAQNERELDELSDKLKALHQAGLDLPAPVTDDAPDNMKALLRGVPEIISPAPLRIGKPALAEDLVLNAAQREKVNLLQSLIATDDQAQAPQLTAIDMTLDDSPELDDITGTAVPGTAAAVVSTRPIRRPRPKIDRLLIAILLVTAVILPFVVRGLRIGQLPPLSFAAGSPQAVAFDRVANLQPGEVVLIAAEYGLTDAAELDTTLDTLLRHIFSRGARPVIVSTNAIGLLHAKNVLERGVVSGLDIKNGGTDSSGNVVLTPGTGLNRFGRVIKPNVDYVIAPFIAGDTVGLRTFSQNLALALATDINGKATNLQVTSYNDFALIAVIAERSDDVRRWAEQVAPLTTNPLLIAVSAAAAPMAEPYTAGNVNGMLTGYKDAYTYRAILDAQAPLAPFAGSTLVPTIVPTFTPSLTPTVAPTLTPSLTPTITPTFTPSLTPSITLTPTTTLTPTMTFTPSPTVTVTYTPTNIKATDLPPTWTPTTLPGGSSDIGAQGLTITGVVNVSDAVNVRDNPSRSGKVIASLPSRSTVQIIGRNEDGTWLQIKLDDEQTGWVSAQLIRINEPGTGTPTPVAYNVDENAYVSLLSDSNYQPVVMNLQASPSPSPTVTFAPPATLAAPAAAPLPAQGATIPTPYRDQRWYGMTLGLLAVIGVITLGAVINIVRGLFRRGRK